MSDSFSRHGLLPARLFCPWNSPGQNTGVGSCSLLQGIFPTQGSNPGLLHCRWIFYHLGQSVILKEIWEGTSQMYSGNLPSCISRFKHHFLSVPSSCSPVKPFLPSIVLSKKNIMWDQICKVFFFFFWLSSMWDLSCLTKNWNHASCIGSAES